MKARSEVEMNAQLLLKLVEIQAVKFGQFTLKSGIASPIYIDLRLVISYPDLLKEIAEAFWSKIQSLRFDLLCGVPYTALPFATAISLMYQKPMIMRRKEIKDYGTKKIIEGQFKTGQQCLIIEDLITSGLSIFETIEPLEKEGLHVKDIAVLLDREQGGHQKVIEKGYHLHAVFTLTELLEHVLKKGFADSATVAQVKNFLSQKNS